VEFNRTVAKTFPQLRLGALRIAAQNNQPQIPDARSGKSNSLHDKLDFLSARFPSRNAEDRDAQSSASQNALLGAGLPWPMGKFAPTGIKHPLPVGVLIQEIFSIGTVKTAASQKAQRLAHRVQLRRGGAIGQSHAFR